MTRFFSSPRIMFGLFEPEGTELTYVRPVAPVT